MYKLRACILAIILMPFSALPAFSGSGFIGTISPVFVEGVGIIALDGYTQHKAGNFEIKIKNGFALPPGVSCDTNYITTLQSVDPDKSMRAVLMAAQITGKSVILMITDDSAYTAFPGRCSLILAALDK